MRTAWALANGPLRTARGGAGGGAGGRLTPGLLAVVGFAVTTAFALSVVGGLLGFQGRADEPSSDLVADLAPTYVVLAWTAVVLLVVPLVTLGAGAARLGVARRDARLATLRLLGATGGDVVALTVLETARQGLVGAAAGVVGYGLLLPVFSSIPFMGEPYSAGELWVGLPALAVALVAVPLVAALSAMVSLRRVVVTPLGVARRTTPPALRWVRAVAVVLAVGAFAAVAKLNLGIQGAVVTVILLGLLGAVLGAINLMGPWLIGLLARVMVRRATTPARLLAGRRLLDDPRAAWRVVAGLGLGGFVAGIVSVVPAMAQSDGDPAGDLLAQDLLTGGILTLSIAFVVAAASAGIAQAASVLDRRQEYALQHLAGVPVELFDAVRRRVVIAPLVLVAGTSAVVGLGVLLPFFAPSLVAAPQGLAVLAACLLLGGLLVVGATETSRPLLRAVLRETDVRPG